MLRLQQRMVLLFLFRLTMIRRQISNDAMTAESFVLLILYELSHILVLKHCEACVYVCEKMPSTVRVCLFV